MFDELIWWNNYNFGKYKLDKTFVREFWLKDIQNANIHFKRLNINVTTDLQPQDIFAEVKVEGNLSLYIQRKISITGTENIFKNNILYNYDVLEADPKYFIKLPSNHYLVLNKLRRISFLKLFPEKKRVLAKIIRDNHLNLKIESDFVKLIELINKAQLF